MEKQKEMLITWNECHDKLHDAVTVPEIEQAMQDAMAKDLLWPNRLVLAQTRAPGVTPPTILSVAELRALENDDPLLRAEKALEAQPAVSALVKERAPAGRLGALLEIFINATGSGGDAKRS